MSLRVLHVIPSVSPKQGGPSFALPLFARALVECGVKVTIATTDDDGPGMRLDVPLNQVVTDQRGIESIYFRKNTEFYKVSRPLARWLRRHVSDYDVVHIHALFSFSSWAAARAARLAGVPYVVRPLGVLNEWGMENRRRFLKQGSLRLIELPILRGAAAIHYTAEAEAREAALAHPGIVAFPSVVIPIPIEAVSNADPARFYQRFPAAVGRPIILFLSRLDPKKGVELLLSAFAEIRQRVPNALLAIAGSGEKRYVDILHRQARELGCAEDVLWMGFVEGEDKSAILKAATLFVLPSYSENFGIAVAEALAAGVPVILSEKIALAEDLRTAQAGMTVECAAPAISQGVLELLSNPTRRAALAEKGREFAATRFSLAVVGQELKQLYQSMIRKRVEL